MTERKSTFGLLTYKIFRELFGCQVDQILRTADRYSYSIIMQSATRLGDQVWQVKELLSCGIDGLLIHTWGDTYESVRILDAVQGQVPVVTFHDPTPNLGGVLLDDTQGFFKATEHLIQLGHERIGFIGSDWNRTRVGSAKARGYLLAMQKHGLIPKRIPGRTFLTKTAYHLGKRLRLGTESFTALVCRNDYTAIGVCRGLRESGLRVPEDVAVVGNGDLDVAAYITPPLTTLATPYEAIAEAAMDLMLEQLQGQDAPRQITLQSPLVVRESCGANRGEK